MFDAPTLPAVLVCVIVSLILSFPANRRLAHASLLPSLPTDGIKWKGLGALRFTTDTNYAVLTNGASNNADIVMAGVR